MPARLDRGLGGFLRVTHPRMQAQRVGMWCTAACVSWVCLPLGSLVFLGPPKPPKPPAPRRVREQQHLSSGRTVVCEDRREVSVESACEKSIEHQLLAARPVTWRGAGELLQVPWGRPPKGMWLVLDLCGWNQWALHCSAVAGKDIQARSCAQAVMPSVVHAADVEQVTVDLLLPFLAKREIRGIIVGGGSPCQGNSFLNRHRQGLSDKRSLQPALLVSLVQSLRNHAATKELDVFAFLENVAAAPSEVLARCTEWMQVPPILIDGASCGWVSRRGAYWVSTVAVKAG